MKGEWTPDAVQEGFIQAWESLRRMPDREKGWMRSGTSSLWRQVQREWGAYSQDAEDVRLTLGLRAVEVDQMEEALQWLELLRPEDRKLVGAVLPVLAKGYSRIPWGRIKARRGLEGKPDTLKKRYRRALDMIAAALNTGIDLTNSKSRQEIVQG
ncbi:DUF6362 family protein [Tardibacter chloracetimidivorans]|nr:DUF6362 family protein [Tardibacter chloracetimidivorans]